MPQRPSRGTLVLGALLVGAALLTYWLAAEHASAPEVPPTPTPQPRAVTAAAPQASVASAGKRQDPKHAGVPVAGHAVHPAEGFYSGDVYASAWQVLTQRGPASRRWALALTMPCLEVRSQERLRSQAQEMGLHTPTLNANDAKYAQRLHAKAVLAQRCSQASAEALRR